MVRSRFSKITALLLLTSALAVPMKGQGREYLHVRSTLLMNQTLNEKLKANVDALTKLTEFVSHIKLADSDSPEQREAVIASAENIIRSLDFIHQDLSVKKLILSDEVLSQLIANAEFLISILGKLDRANPKLDKKSQERIQAIEKGIDLKMSHFNEIKGTETKPPTTYPTVRIIVTTLKNGSPESNLRVYYLEEAYFDGDTFTFYDAELAKSNTKTFDKVTSPPLASSNRELPEADYRVWAGRGNDSTPVSDIKKLLVRRPSKGQEIPVDLLINR